MNSTSALGSNAAHDLATSKPAQEDMDDARFCVFVAFCWINLRKLQSQSSQGIFLLDIFGSHILVIRSYP